MVKRARTEEPKVSRGKAATDQMPRAMVVSLCLTAVWIIVLYVILALAKPCNVDRPWYNPFARHLTCSEWNVVGDFLAGAFAPLAFLWLVTAVFIQSQELKAQREELEATREEMKESRSVLTDQASTAKATADYVSSQTRYQEEQLRQFKLDKLLDRLRSVLLGRIADITVLQSAHVGQAFFAKAHHSDPDRDQTIAQIAEKIIKHVSEWRERLESGKAQVVHTAEDALKILADTLAMILSEERSKAEFVQLQAMMLPQLSQDVGFLLEVVEKQRKR